MSFKILIQYMILPYLELEDFLILSGKNIILRDYIINRYCPQLPKKEEILRKGHFRSVQYYLEKDLIWANPMLPNPEVELAVKHGHLEIYKLLLDHNFVISTIIYDYMLEHKMELFLDYLMPGAKQKLDNMLKFWKQFTK